MTAKKFIFPMRVNWAKIIKEKTNIPYDKPIR